MEMLVTSSLIQSCEKIFKSFQSRFKNLSDYSLSVQVISFSTQVVVVFHIERGLVSVTLKFSVSYKKVLACLNHIY